MSGRDKGRPVRLDALVGVVCILLFIAFCTWTQSHLLGQRLSAAEVERYVTRVGYLPVSPDERANLALRIRAWAAADDGEPVFVLDATRTERVAVSRYRSRRVFLETLTDPANAAGQVHGPPTGLILVSDASG